MAIDMVLKFDQPSWLARAFWLQQFEWTAGRADGESNWYDASEGGMRLRQKHLWQSSVAVWGSPTGSTCPLDLFVLVLLY